MIVVMREHRGMPQVVTDELNKLLDEPIKRQQVILWFHPDAERRIIPTAGNAILLQRAFERARALVEQPKATHYHD